MNDVLITETLDAVRVITLNRPGARNALGGELIEALYDGLVAADADPAIRVVVLTGADPAFCAGVDLKEAGRDGKKYFDRYRTHNCIGQVAKMRTPVIGAVNGPTFTGGLEMALGCDFLIASERAVFADTHVRVGVLPGGGMTARLPLAVGWAQARRMSMTGEVVDAEQALRLGLVSEVAPHEQLRERALAAAGRISSVDERMMLGVKQMYVESAAGYLDHALGVEDRVKDANVPDFDKIEQRRVEVMASNHSQLAPS